MDAIMYEEYKLYKTPTEYNLRIKVTLKDNRVFQVSKSISNQEIILSNMDPDHLFKKMFDNMRSEIWRMCLYG